MGISLALIDAAILALAQTPFEWLFVFSNLGKIIAGFLGGFVSKMRHAAASRLEARS